MSPIDLAKSGRLLARLMLLFCCVGTLAPSGYADKLQDKENLIKAGFITKFPAYVTWPPSKDRQQAPVFRYCVLGPHAIAGQLRSLVNLSDSRPRNAQVHVVDQIAASLPCELLFIPDDQAHRLPSVVSAVGDRAVLLIGETPGLARQGAHINLYHAEGRIKFEINRSTVKKSGLQISFRLLELARVID